MYSSILTLRLGIRCFFHLSALRPRTRTLRCAANTKASAPSPVPCWCRNCWRHCSWSSPRSGDKNHGLLVEKETYDFTIFHHKNWWFTINNGDFAMKHVKTDEGKHGEWFTINKNGETWWVTIKTGENWWTLVIWPSNHGETDGDFSTWFIHFL